MRIARGFSLVELMIVITIIGVLLSLALPTYNNHFKRSKFTEVVLASNALQRQVEICFYIKHSLSECDSFEKTSSKKSDFIAPNYISDIEISNSSGTYQIKSTAASEASISSSGDTYIITAIVNSNQLLWQLSSLSTCINEGTC
ncbi:MULTISPECIES: prepilin-type N-terminal cleavage/methylation domain-containing protein [unclassified Pseudoalteromonas]|uniref:pilin n=1 Tax=unclassified Pseudoalteromonas TaxID=194690 RepID=UPI00386F71B4